GNKGALGLRHGLQRLQGLRWLEVRGGPERRSPRSGLRRADRTVAIIHKERSARLTGSGLVLAHHPA
ncbi:MAG TPA: hypothetical protein V6D46_07835, partial [Coleofasciculaceae cyanobacterium]